MTAVAVRIAGAPGILGHRLNGDYEVISDGPDHNGLPVFLKPACDHIGKSGYSYVYKGTDKNWWIGDSSKSEKDTTRNDNFGWAHSIGDAGFVPSHPKRWAVRRSGYKYVEQTSMIVTTFTAAQWAMEKEIAQKRALILDNWSSVRVLDLSRFSEISKAPGLLNLAALPLPDCLEEFSLRHPIAASISFPFALKKLNLWAAKIGSSGASTLSLPARLKHLVLAFNDIGPEGIAALKLPDDLKILDLQNNSFGSKGTAALTLPTSLTVLKLNSNEIGAAGAAALRLNASLTDLNLHYCNISDAGVARLTLPASLLKLDLGYNSIGDGVANLSLPKRLTYLDLQGNEIEAAGAAGLRLPNSLRMLQLNQNNIRARGAKALTLPPSLTELYLDQNNIGSAGAAALVLPVSLIKLTVRHNGIGAGVIHTLAKTNPTCEIWN